MDLDDLRCETWQNDDPDDRCSSPQKITCADCGAKVCAQHTWSTYGRFVCAVCFGITGYQHRPEPAEA